MLSKTLVLTGALSEAQVAELQAQAQAERKPFAQFLLEKGVITPENLAKAYAQHYELPLLEKIPEKLADPTLLSKIPFHFLRQNLVMPLLTDGTTVTIATADPTNFQGIDAVRLMLGTDAPLTVVTVSALIDALNRFYPLEGTKEMIEDLAQEQDVSQEGLEFGEIDEKDILGMANEAPVIKLVNHILLQAAKRGASDIHIEPFEKEVRVRFRIDGVMHLAFTPPKRVQAAIGSRIKIMANLNIAEKRKPQDGRIQIKVADKAIDIRVSVLPVAQGERIVMRLLDKSRTFGALKELNLSERDFKVVSNATVQPNGIILVSGPTGSGKTSTLYSVLSELNKPDVNIITVEDPVEYQMDGVSQVQVKEKIGLTFAAALRAILRQDPDVVMIGETRDAETAQIAIQAALTGHLVLSTIHTNSAPATITRLIDMGIEPFLISSSIVCIIAQRLVRKLCPACKKKYTPAPELIGRLGLTAEEASKITFYEPGGCEECSETGYRGRLAIFEVMQMSNAVAKLTMDKSDASVITQQAVSEGMTLLVTDGIRKIKEGLTTVEEVLSVATSQEELYEITREASAEPAAPA